MGLAHVPVGVCMHAPRVVAALLLGTFAVSTVRGAMARGGGGASSDADGLLVGTSNRTATGDNVEDAELHELMADSLANMFHTDQHSQFQIAQAKTWLLKQSPAKPRACHLILSLPLNCGRVCTREASGKFCTQENSLVRALQSLRKKFRKGDSGRLYPVVVLHNDITVEQQQRIVSQAGMDQDDAPMVWVKINFDKGSLPSYLGASGRIADYYLKYHRDAKKFNAVDYPGVDASQLTLAHPRSHGWGYVMMCRMFAGLVFFARPLQMFDYYWRIDAGDSALRDVGEDPFVHMAQKGLVYGYGPLYTEEGCPWRNFKLDARYNDVRGAFNAKASKLPGLQRLDPLDCAVMPRHAYNNFEAVDMRFFRTRAYAEYFVEWDKRATFFCPYKQGRAEDCDINADFRTVSNGYALNGVRVLGDAEFRGMSLVTFAKQSQIGKLPGINYEHPVPWASC